MTIDALLLAACGILAILGGGAVLFLGRERYPSFLAAAALITLGLLQFGWARSIYDVSGSEVWFELSLAFALLVSLVWVLLSRTLCLAPGTGHLGLWRVYIVALALSAIAALLFVGVASSPIVHSWDNGRIVFPLRPATRAMVLGIFLNVMVATASFESTYLSLPLEARRAFRPGLFGILIGAAFFGYHSIAGLTSGLLSSADISLGCVPVSLLALALPYSLIRGRLTETRVRRKVRPLLRTTSVALSIGFLLLMTALLWLTHATGWSLARGLWVVVVAGSALCIVALVVSNRVYRRVQRLIDPLLGGRSIDRRAISANVTMIAGQASNVFELCRLIPSHVRDVAGTDPVTLFLMDTRDSRYVVVASTMEPTPTVAVSASEPLATELDRTRRAIRLRGRPDDLEYIPIYVENAAQISACAALCAAPIFRAEELLGFLLCGQQAGGRAEHGPLLPLLDHLCRRYSARFETLEASVEEAKNP